MQRSRQRAFPYSRGASAKQQLKKQSETTHNSIRQIQHNETSVSFLCRAKTPPVPWSCCTGANSNTEQWPAITEPTTIQALACCTGANNDTEQWPAIMEPTTIQAVVCCTGANNDTKQWPAIMEPTTIQAVACNTGADDNTRQLQKMPLLT